MTTRSPLYRACSIRNYGRWCSKTSALSLFFVVFFFYRQSCYVGTVQSTTGLMLNVTIVRQLITNRKSYQPTCSCDRQRCLYPGSGKMHVTLEMVASACLWRKRFRYFRVKTGAFLAHLFDERTMVRFDP